MRSIKGVSSLGFVGGYVSYISSLCIGGARLFDIRWQGVAYIVL